MTCSLSCFTFHLHHWSFALYNAPKSRRKKPDEIVSRKRFEDADWKIEIRRIEPSLRKNRHRKPDELIPSPWALQSLLNLYTDNLSHKISKIFKHTLSCCFLAVIQRQVTLNGKPMLLQATRWIVMEKNKTARKKRMYRIAVKTWRKRWDEQIPPLWCSSNRCRKWHWILIMNFEIFNN